MHRSGNEVTYWSAVAMGIGAMVGAGIFALLGAAGAIAGSAVWISFVVGGVIALLSGYSFGRLGARFPAAGGLVEYLVQAFGVGRFSGTMSVMMYIGSLVAVSLVARTFGNYAAALLPAFAPGGMVEALAAAIVLGFMLLNLNGARAMTQAENLIVLTKVAVLVGFAIVGIALMTPERLLPRTYPPPSAIFYAVAITFFAYEGFRIITNAAEDMANPARTLPRAMLTSIVLVMVLYVAVSLAVFGTLSPDQVVAAKDFALAEAAKPAFGQTGFTIVAIAALLSTGSAINASLYAVTNVTYELARKGELPSAFAQPIAHSREGLVISSVIIMCLAIFFALSSIAAIGAVSMLLIHMTVHIGHLRLLGETGASPVMVVLAIAANAAAVILGGYHLASTSPMLLAWIAGFFVLAFAIEMVLSGVVGRSVKARADDGTPVN